VVVRVSAKLSYRGRSVETSLLLNSGYEAPGPRVLLPKALAEELGITEGRSITVRTSIGEGVVLDAGVSIEVEVEGRTASALVRISEAETEAIANDALVEELGIIILKPKTGTYRFTDDPYDMERESVEPTFWTGG